MMSLIADEVEIIVTIDEDKEQILGNKSRQREDMKILHAFLIDEF